MILVVAKLKCEIASKAIAMIFTKICDFPLYLFYTVHLGQLNNDHANKCAIKSKQGIYVVHQESLSIHQPCMT